MSWQTIDGDTGQKDAVFEFLINGETLPKKSTHAYELKLPIAAEPSLSLSPRSSAIVGSPVASARGAPGSPKSSTAPPTAGGAAATASTSSSPSSGGSTSGWFNNSKKGAPKGNAKRDEPKPLSMRYQLGVPKLEIVPPRDYDNDDSHCNREVDPLMEGKEALLSARSMLSPGRSATGAAPVVPNAAASKPTVSIDGAAADPAQDEVLNMLAHAMVRVVCLLWA